VGRCVLARSALVPAQWLAVMVVLLCLTPPPLRCDESSDLGKLPKFLQQEAAATQVLERGSSEGVVPAQPGPSASKDPFDGYEEKFREFAERTDKTFGTDMRGRKASEDLRDLLAEFKTRFDASGADRAQLSAELQARVQTLEKYWITVMAVRSNRDIWPDFLARNGLPADTPHTAEVIAAEQALVTALRSGTPSEEWATLGGRLRDAYVEERHANKHWKPVSEADYHPRLSPCPPPASATSGSQQAKTGTMSRTPADFYPEASRKALLEGSVLLSVGISATGCAERIAIAGSSGSELLDDAAMRFGETIEFLPAEKDGKAVASTKELRVTFKETT
jgi:TonB family protein